MALGKLDEEEISGINVTPLVDVVLVLLVIFMITAPALYQGVLDVKLPASSATAERTRTTLEVVMDRTGRIEVDGSRMTPEQLRDWVAGHRCETALIVADRRVAHGEVIELIDLLRSSGVQRFSFGVEAGP